MKGWTRLTAVVALVLALGAWSGEVPPVGRPAPAAWAAQDSYSIAQCMDELAKEDLTPEESEAQRLRNEPICAAIIAALPNLAPGGYAPSSFILCAGQAGGARVTGPGPALNAAIKQCIQQSSPDAITACEASVGRISSDADTRSTCEFIFQGTPLGVSSADVLACVTAQYLLGTTDFFDAGATCYERLATDEAADKAIQQAIADEQPATVTTPLPGADECLKLMGSGAGATDSAEARCAFILQAAPAGVDLNALARCIGSAADFMEAYRRCAESLAAPAPVEPVISGLSCAPSPVAANTSVNCSATISGATSDWRWTAAGGNPSTRDGTTAGGPNQAGAVSFTTAFQTSGDKGIELTACNRVPATADQAERNLCATSRTTVTVREAAPRITALGCAPASVAVNAAVTCTPTIEGAVTSRTWSAAGGTPPSGSGPTFATRFATPGAKQITLEVCNGAVCGAQFQNITVTGEARCTQWNITGTWHTSQGNGYNPTFVLQQIGTGISGSASIPSHEQSRAGYRSPNGHVTGMLAGDQLSITVTWTGQNGPVTGRYTATIVQGRLSNGNAGGQSWSGTGPTQCVSQ